MKYTIERVSRPTEALGLPHACQDCEGFGYELMGCGIGSEVPTWQIQSVDVCDCILSRMKGVADDSPPDVAAAFFFLKDVEAGETYAIRRLAAILHEYGVGEDLQA